MNWQEWPTASLEAAVLTFLEQSEARLASLGILDVRHNVAALCSAYGQQDGAPTYEALQQALGHLVTDGSVLLLGTTHFGPESEIRSHVAEVVRLLRLVRQRFPYHRRSEDSPPLVRDLLWTPLRRLRPERNRHLAELELPPVTDPALKQATERSVEVLRTAVEAYIGPGRPYCASGFQLDAFRTLLAAVLTPGEVRRGQVVAAGTGTGKTHAFFFPALVAALIRRHQGVAGTVAICVYNRQRLAVNQFQDFVDLIHKVNVQGGYSLSIGIDFGEVPYRNEDFRQNGAGRPKTLARWEWDAATRMWECPWAVCPHPGCGQPLRVRSTGKPVLACNDHGPFAFIRVTRGSIADDPPTFYVATGASLHSRLQDSVYRGVFGEYRGHRSPDLIMFDEIHLYEGVEGIQSALLARRLRRRLERADGKPVMVGLSATIADPVQFFSEFTGLSQSDIGVITPDESELRWDGVEHFITIKSEPDEEVSPLSTLLQTAMLLGHLLPRPASGPPRTFGFTDSLDRVGRWDDRQRDAEGNQRLYALRQPGITRVALGAFSNQQQVQDPVTYSMAGPRHDCTPCMNARTPDVGCPVFADGECWFSMVTLGTTAPLSIGIQSSRNTRGLESSDLLIATSSLEVGFDDARVRAVLQYQAPTGPAAFTQRRGRAGRPSDSRTFVVSVLSPYRRQDEFYFRNTHLLTDPVFAKIPLNAANRVLARAHAMYLLLDRVAQQQTFSSSTLARNDATRLMASVEGRNWGYLLDDLSRTFGVDDQELLALVDAEHVGVLRALLPELVSRVASMPAPGAGERRAYTSVGDVLANQLPPDLMTPAPSELIRSEPDPASGADPEHVDIMFGLSEGAPGNVRYRYSLAMWVPLPRIDESVFEVALPYGVDPTATPLGLITEGELPPAAARDLGLPPGAQIPLRRPTRVSFQRFLVGRNRSRFRLQNDGRIVEGQNAGRNILDNSNSRLLRYELADIPKSYEEWTPILTPEIFSHPLSAAFHRVQVAKASADAPVVVRRFALGAEFSVALERGDAEEGRVGFVLDRQPVALGQILSADGLRFTWNGGSGFRPDDDLIREVAHRAFQWSCRRTVTVGNVFSRAKAIEAVAYCAAQEILSGRSPADWLSRFETGDSDALAATHAAFDRLFDPKIRTAAAFAMVVGDPASRRAIRDAWNQTVGAPGFRSPAMEAYLKDSLSVSIGAALVGGIERVLGLDLSDAVAWRSGLVANGRPAAAPVDIDLYELTSGGIGILEQVAATWRRQPTALWNAAEESAYACPTARHQKFVEQLASLDDGAFAHLLEGAADLVTGARTSLEDALHRFRSNTLPGIHWDLEDQDLRSLMRLVGKNQDSRFELPLVRAVTREAAQFRTAVGRWPSARELGAHVVAGLEGGRFAPGSLTTLATNLAQWIDPNIDRERYRRTLQSQIERRYARSCSPSCPSCIGAETTPEIEPDRELLTAYFDAQARSSTISVERDVPADVLRDVALMWRAGQSCLRLRYGDALCGTVATVLTCCTTERVAGNYSEVEAAASWARTRSLDLARGYFRELGLELGVQVS